jgi:SAM-dependent methyltransferase
MGFVGGALGYRILRAVAPSEPTLMNGGSYASRSKVETLLGKQVWDAVRDKVVIDFGCGAGAGTIELAQRGAKHVHGIDIVEKWLVMGREQAAKVACHNVTFSKIPTEPADVIISMDGFEHFADPAGILGIMEKALKPNGCVLTSFGPTWYHPLGGHLFSVFPWAHLIFSEKALCLWRAHLRNDGAQRFSEVAGGLNRMTIRRFERLVETSPFHVDHLETVPIRSARILHNWVTREFLTAVVRCKLSLRSSADRVETSSGQAIKSYHPAA